MLTTCKHSAALPALHMPATPRSGVLGGNSSHNTTVTLLPPRSFLDSRRSCYVCAHLKGCSSAIKSTLECQ